MDHKTNRRLSFTTTQPVNPQNVLEIPTTAEQKYIGQIESTPDKNTCKKGNV